jgi:hypothetical protein
VAVNEQQQEWSHGLLQKSIFLGDSSLEQTGSVRVTEHLSAFAQPLIQWKSNEYYTNWVCVFVALSIQHAMRVRHIVIRGLPRYTIFYHIIS